MNIDDIREQIQTNNAKFIEQQKATKQEADATLERQLDEIVQQYAELVRKYNGQANGSPEMRFPRNGPLLNKTLRNMLRAKGFSVRATENYVAYGDTTFLYWSVWLNL